MIRGALCAVVAALAWNRQASSQINQATSPANVGSMAPQQENPPSAPAAPENQAPQTQNPPPSPTSLTPQAEPSGSAPLRVMVGKSLLINTSERIKRVSVTDPNVADPLVVAPTQLLVHGRSPGEVSLVIWDEAERSRTFDLRVDVDITAAAEEVHRVFPEEQIQVTASRSAIVLSGHVSTEEVSKRAELITGAYSNRVVNVLSFGAVGAQEVLLEVKFAEVDRAATIQLGANFFSTRGANTLGTVTTGQFGGFTVTGPTTTTSTSPLTGGLITTTTPGSIKFTDALNISLFRSDINFGAVIKALQQKNLLQILAEPNLIAVNGKEASFLAGGEFPFPIVQPSAGTSVVTIQFREFGVRLKFTPVITPAGNIHLRVVPEVSALDFANAITIAGQTIPALSTRRADTEFEIKDGQSFVIAGLMDNRVTKTMSRIPGIGDIPILGNLFRSKNLTKSNSELMVLVTAHRISPTATPTALPKAPEHFLNPDKFDGSKPSGERK